MLFMFIPTFCPDDCPLVVWNQKDVGGQLNHQNMRAELEDWWERYCWRGKFQKTSQGARHVWWGGRTSPYAGLRRGLKESYRCPVITCDHIWWHYCNKYSRKLPFLQSEMASSLFFSTAENSLFWGSARTRDIPRQGMVLGRKKNPAGQSQMHPNVLKCIIHEIQYNSIPIGWNSCICPSYFEAAQAACPPRWGAPLQASHADWDWENWKDPNAGWGGPNAGDRDLEFTNGMEWILPGQYGQTGDEYPDISRFYVESFWADLCEVHGWWRWRFLQTCQTPHACHSRIQGGLRIGRGALLAKSLGSGSCRLDVILFLRQPGTVSTHDIKNASLSLSLSFWASLSLSEPLWASLSLSEPLWASLSLSEPLWVSLSLSESLWVSLSLSESLWVSLSLSESLRLSLWDWVSESLSLFSPIRTQEELYHTHHALWDWSGLRTGANGWFLLSPRCRVDSPGKAL